MFPRTTCVALWVVVIGLLIALFTPLRRAAAGVMAAGMVTLTLIFVLEWIRMIVRLRSARPPWIPSDSQAEDRIHRLNCGPDGSDCDDDVFCTHCPHGFPNGED